MMLGLWLLLPLAVLLLAATLLSQAGATHPEQAGRLRGALVARARACLPQRFADRKTLVVGLVVSRLPMAGLADDGVTAVGFDVDIAYLLADSLGLELLLAKTAPGNWRHELDAQRCDAVIGGLRSGDARLRGFEGTCYAHDAFAIATRQGDGLAEAFATALAGQTENGQTAKALARWRVDRAAVAAAGPDDPADPAQAGFEGLRQA